MTSFWCLMYILMPCKLHTWHDIFFLAGNHSYCGNCRVVFQHLPMKADWTPVYCVKWWCFPCWAHSCNLTWHFLYWRSCGICCWGERNNKDKNSFLIFVATFLLKGVLKQIIFRFLFFLLLLLLWCGEDCEGLYMMACLKPLLSRAWEATFSNAVLLQDKFDILWPII